jgi:hypothetical protein
MAKTGEDLLEQADGTGGELLLGMFPGKTRGQVLVLLEGYLTKGYAGAATVPLTEEEDQDTAAFAYGNWQAYERRLSELAGTGSAQKTLAGQFSVGTTGDQFKELRLKADRWRAIYEGLVPPTDAAQVSTAPPPSRTTTIRTTW